MSWNIDIAHTSVQFTVRHMMISKVRGEFEKFSGTVNLDEANPANTTVDIKIETASVNTRDEKRDGHLRSPDFFNADQYPYMTFKSKRVEVISSDHAHLTGDLTIHGVTKPVVRMTRPRGRTRTRSARAAASARGAPTARRAARYKSANDKRGPEGRDTPSRSQDNGGLKQSSESSASASGNMARDGRRGINGP